MPTYGGTGALTGNSYGDLSTNDAFTIQKKMLPVAKALLTFARFGQKETKSQKEGLEVRWRRYEKFPLATTPIGEGVTPAHDQITHTTIMGTIKQYGSWVPVTDLIVASSTDPVVQEVTEKQAIQIGETLDYLTFTQLRAGTQKICSVTSGDSTATRTNVNKTIAGLDGVTVDPDNASTNLIDTAVRVLERNDTIKLAKMVKASSDYSTEPVDQAFFAVGHVDLRQDIASLPGFVPIEKYAGNGTVLPGEIGKVGLVRFILTTQAEPWTGAGKAPGGSAKLLTTSGVCDVYPVLIFGQDAFGVVQLAGMDAITSMVNLPKSSAVDPLGQRGSIGWKTTHLCSILQDLWMYRIEVACSSLT